MKSDSGSLFTNCGPAPHHHDLHERHREPDEDGRQDQLGKAKKTNNQASFGGSILKANMEVEAVIQLAHSHDLDETGMPCVCIGVGLLGVFARFA